jgi:hypothetical protein
MERLGAGEENGLGLGDVWIRHAAIHGAYGGARLLSEEADALGAFLRDDIENVLRKGRMHDAVQLVLHATLVDGGVGTLHLAGAAVDAFRGNYRCHVYTSPYIGSST